MSETPTFTPTTIIRDGFPPLKFNGTPLGSGDNRDHNSTRWTEVKIWRTKGGKLIWRIARRTQWQGESDRLQAGSCQTAAEAIESLKDDQGFLGSASQECLRECSQADPEFRAAYVEFVE